MNNNKTTRKCDYKINSIFPNRWSSRSFSGTQLKKEHLMPLFEAARWAPSSFNAQPWRFIYALKGTPAFDELCNSLIPFNRDWAQHAGALVMIISRKKYTYNEKPNEAHVFDAGAAWQNFALQACDQGLHCHAMEGFDETCACSATSTPEGYKALCIIAVGYPGDGAYLDDELKSLEKPSQRIPVSEFVFENSFTSKP